MSLTAPLEVISTAQAGDIAVSKGPNDIMDGIYRAKQYVKDEQKRCMFHARNNAFDQPYQWAADRYSRSKCTEDPAGIDRVFLGQTVDCNLRCDECFAGSGCEKIIKHVTAQEYVNAYDKFCSQHGWCSTLRISGGEPMLHQEWVREVLLASFKSTTKPLVRWVDTNLTLEVMSSVTTIGSTICGCFKPNRKYHDGRTVDLGNQLDIVRSIIEDVCPLFLYWPAWDMEEDTSTLKMILHELMLIDKYLPLRLTVIETKKYGASPNMEHVTPEELKVFFDTRRNAYFEFLFDNYHPDIINMPSHYTLWM